MAHHAATNPKRVPPPIHDKGSAHKHAQHGRRTSTVEGTNVLIGSGLDISGTSWSSDTAGVPPGPGIALDTTGLTAYNGASAVTMQISAADGSVTINQGGNLTVTGGTITGGTIRTSAAFPSVTLTTAGLAAYNSAGIQEVFISATDGSFTSTGTSTITGGTFQTAAPAVHPRLVFDGTGIKGYNATGTQTLSIGSDGSVTISGNSTITGGTFQTSTSNPRIIFDATGLRAFDTGGTQTFNLANDGSLALNLAEGAITVDTSGLSFSSVPSTDTGARIVLDSHGITGYDATNTQQFYLDDTTGLIEATGVLTSQPGSTVPWQTTGFFIGGGNLLFNASAEDPTTVQQLLYINTGTGVTAGTFQLQYGTNTATSNLNWNATAAQVQTALQATGVLPTGATVSCTGGPLPGTPITITLGNLLIAPTVLAAVSQSLTGGTATVGPQPVLMYKNNVPISWWTFSNGVLDFIAFSSAYHGGNIFRLTSTGAVNPSMSQTVGPWGLKVGTNYTLSAYFRAPIAARHAQITLNFQDINFNSTGSYTTTSSWTTTSDWQRLLLTAPVPGIGARQQIAITGQPIVGTFQLIYNGQMTGLLQYNATAAQVQAALQALPNVGAGGVIAATGGPLPNTPVKVTFASPPASSPAMMTYVNNLGAPFTGALGISDSRFGRIAFGVLKNQGVTSQAGIVITNVPSVYINVQFGITDAGTGEQFYVDANQLEVGDAPTAFAPQPDEIVANVIQANMINVGQLSAISANLGNMTAGTVTGATIQTAASGTRIILDSAGLRSSNGSFNLSGSTGSFTAVGGTITGATFQTGAGNPHTVIDNTGFYVTLTSGVKTVTIDAGAGVGLATGGYFGVGSALNQISWNLGGANTPPTTAVLWGSAENINGAQANGLFMAAYGPATDGTSSSVLVQSTRASGEGFNQVQLQAYNQARSAVYTASFCGDSTFKWNGPAYATSWNISSSRELKTSFTTLQPDDVLNKIRALTVDEWEFKQFPNIRHIGPVAEEFNESFRLGANDPAGTENTISVQDVAGVALLGIQGLVQRLQKQNLRINELQFQIELQKAGTDKAKLTKLLQAVELDYYTGSVQLDTLQPDDDADDLEAVAQQLEDHANQLRQLLQGAKK